MKLLENFEREYIGQVLKRCEGNISRAARESGLHRKSIERLVKKYQLGGVAMWALGYETGGMWSSLHDFGVQTAVRQPNVRLNAPDQLRVGEDGLVRSRVLDSGDGVKDHRVTLQRKGVNGWVSVDVARTNSDGKARFGVTARKQVHWRVVSAKSWQYQRAVSSTSTTRAKI